jgi:hypothetical protein
MTHDEMIALIQAHKDGKEIEIWDGFKWVSDYGDPCWYFSSFQYRIKPPQIEAWGVVDGDGDIGLFEDKDDAVKYMPEHGGTLIRLIPDPNYTQSPVSDNE